MRSRLYSMLGVGELKLVPKVEGVHCWVIRLSLQDVVPCPQARAVLAEHPAGRQTVSGPFPFISIRQHIYLHL